MRFRRAIEIGTLVIIGTVLTIGMVLTIQILQKLAFEDFSIQFSLWGPTRQERAILQLREILGRIELGAPVDQQEYARQRDLLSGRIRISREFLLTAPESLQGEDLFVTRLEEELARYMAIEGQQTITPELARQLLPVVDTMLGLSQDLINSRRLSIEATYQRVIQGTNELKVIQIATLSFLFLMGGGLFWLTRRTLASDLLVAQAQAEAAERQKHKMELVHSISLLLSSSLDQQEIFDLAVREAENLFRADHVALLVTDLHDVNQGVLVATRPVALTASRRIPLQDCPLVGDVQSAGRPLVIPVLATDPRAAFAAEMFRDIALVGIMIAPMIGRSGLLGLIALGNCTAHEYTHEEQTLFQALTISVTTALEKARLYQESVTRVEQELEIARHIQSYLFPRSLPHIDGLAVAAVCLPARETGGDFYDCILLRDERLAVIVGDVSGKSIPAAMLMAVARSTARSEAYDHETPQEMMRETNYWMVKDIPPRTFIALSYATVDLVQRRLALANGGQLAPLRRQASGAIEYLEAIGPSLPIGALPDIHYATLDVPLESGDLIVFYTDGVVEAHNSQRQLFGFERLEALIRAYGHASPPQFIEVVLQSIKNFTNGMSQHDDITLVVLRVE